MELKVFIVTLTTSGYNVLPQKPLYCSKTVDTYNRAIKNAIHRYRFELTMKCLHFKSDKYSKLCPLISRL